MNDDSVSLAQVVDVIERCRRSSAVGSDGEIARLTRHCGAYVVTKALSKLPRHGVFEDGLSPDTIAQSGYVDGRHDTAMLGKVVDLRDGCSCACLGRDCGRPKGQHDDCRGHHKSCDSVSSHIFIVRLKTR